MADIPVLTCPVCDKSAWFSPDALTEPDALKDAAWDHLAAHRLDESKRAIYAVMMVEQLDRRAVTGADSVGEATGDWVTRLPPRLAA